MNILLTITYINGDYTTFDIYTSNGTSDILYTNNIQKFELLSGYQILNVPNDTINIKLIPTNSICTNITIIDVIDTNYIYVEKVSSNTYITHIKLRTIVGNGTYSIVNTPFDQLMLMITNDSNTNPAIEPINISDTRTTYYFIDNTLYLENEVLTENNIVSFKYTNLYIKINNGNSSYVYEFSNNTDVQISNNEILNSTKKYINITSTIE